ncbi:MAG: hypothetical protein U0325_13455 [Polyangiales bacterium]
MTVDALARARAASRVARLLQSRGLAWPADALHLLRACTRCGAVAQDLRALHRPLCPDGETPVGDVDDLHALLAALDDALPAPACACNASVGVARYLHAMGRGDLVVERAGGRDRLAALYGDGDEDEVPSVEAAFGRPLTPRARWVALLDRGGAARAEVEPGHGLLVGDSVDDIAAPEVGVEVLGLDASALRAPGWRWLLDALAAGRWAGRVLAVSVRVEVLYERLACALARGGVTLSRDAATGRWRAQRDEVGSDVDVAEALRALLRENLTLGGFAMRLAGEVAARIAKVTDYVAAARAARPEAPLRVEGDLLWGAPGRSLDLTVAPFEDAPEDALARDLRMLLDASPPWVAPDRVCPCGAARQLVPRLLSAESLAALQDQGRAPLVRRRVEADGALRAVEVVSLECDRHRAPLTRAELDAWGWRDVDLADRVDRDAPDVTFHARLATWRDDDGRWVLLAQGPDLASAALRDDWVRGLGALAGVSEGAAWVCVTSPHGVVAWESAADPTLVGRAMAVDALLDPVGRRAVRPLTDARAVAVTAPRGRFVRLAAPGDDAPT